MGLAAMLSRSLRDRARIVLTAELDPVFVSTIGSNYAFFAQHIGSPQQIPPVLHPTDVGSSALLEQLRALQEEHGNVTLLLAGPPCQGFSKSNVRSRDHHNPLNLQAFHVVACIQVAKPQVAIIENVPGIQTMASSRDTRISVSTDIEQQLRVLGYHVGTFLLNAADYGVPQHRVRSFTIAVRNNLLPDMSLSSLVPAPRYGPGRQSRWLTVADALSDLPSILSGATTVAMPYPTPACSDYQSNIRRHSPAIFDHVGSKHSAYVTERFAAIPQGGNWQSIRQTLGNYSKPDNTHNNIYRRLDEQQPAPTIGNFRKSMTVNPWANRGLSLREAARLQSLPDWLRFFPDTPARHAGHLKGLSSRQQQIGNAVCFLLTQALVDHLFSNA